MVKNKLVWLGVGTLLTSSVVFAEDDALMQTAKTLFQPLPKHAHVEEANPESSEEMVDLGRKLYFDPRLSASGNISCNTCHNLSTYGVDNLRKSPGVKAQLGGA